MRLFESILAANHRALSGDTHAGLHPSEHPGAFPLVALTCIDPRLNRLLPEVLGVREEDFIWLRNAGNIIFDPMSSMMRTLSLACAVKGGKEIAVIGHTDCRVRQTSVSQLIESFRALGINRASLPDNLIEFFGLFSSERQNVINGVNHVRRSPLISPRVPVHGLIVDVDTGRLEWLVNGYETLGTPAASPSPFGQKIEQVKEVVDALANINLGELKFPDLKIGDLVLDPKKWMTEVAVLKEKVKEQLPAALSQPHKACAAPEDKNQPHAVPVPPPIRLGKSGAKRNK